MSMLGVNAYQPVRCFEVHGNDIARLSKLWSGWISSLRCHEGKVQGFSRSIAVY